MKVAGQGEYPVCDAAKKAARLRSPAATKLLHCDSAHDLRERRS
jgi:hypothetical protein